MRGSGSKPPVGRRPVVVGISRTLVRWTEAKKKLPVHFRLKDRSPFAFAGVWDVWKGPGGPVFTCAILTTTPNELTQQVHDRMPVILPESAYASWLDQKTKPDELLSLLAPYSADEMVAAPANPATNKPTFQGPDFLTLPS
jgi:putative SOS response-associated peptidase YedK